MNHWYLIIPAIILLLLLTFLILLHFRKKHIIRKVQNLFPEEKSQLINEIIDSFGYVYDIRQDIFATRLNAPQKNFGYTHFYDLSAAYFNMVFDYETIYFDYGDRTWLIEMWKGQYGINTGCELGVYYADSLVLPTDYKKTLFHAVDTKDMPDISLQLNRYTDKISARYTRLGRLRFRHWWLTLFKMGIFTKPKDLFVNTALRFKDYAMLHRFLDSFRKVLPNTGFKINGLTMYFTFCCSERKYSLWKKLIRSLSLTSCRILCKWFLFITRPFQNTGDKFLYIYYYLPFTLRFWLRKKPGK